MTNGDFETIACILMETESDNPDFINSLFYAQECAKMDVEIASQYYTHPESLSEEYWTSFFSNLITEFESTDSGYHMINIEYEDCSAETDCGTYSAYVPVGATIIQEF